MDEIEFARWPSSRAGEVAARYALATCVAPSTVAATQRVGVLRDRIRGGDRWVASAGAEGRPAVLDGEDLRPLAGAFAGRRLTARSARRTCAIGVDFSGAQLQGAHFDGADLRDADFSGADLRGASFAGAKLWHARFDRANLQALTLAKGSPRPVNLDGASYHHDCFARSLVGWAACQATGAKASEFL